MKPLQAAAFDYLDPARGKCFPRGRGPGPDGASYRGQGTGGVRALIYAGLSKWADYEMSADLWLGGGAQGGIVFHANDSTNNFYYFAVDAADPDYATCQAWKYPGGNPVAALSDPIPVLLTQPIYLRMMRLSDSTFACYANGAKVKFGDTEYVGGKIGLLASGNYVDFDNVAVHGANAFWPGSGQEEPLILDFFNHLNLDGAPFMWGLLGKWEPVLDSDPNHGWLLKGTYDAGAPAKAFRGERTWTDYSVQAQFKLGDQGLPATQCAAGVYLRIRDEDPMTTDGLFQDFYQCFVFYSAYPPSAWKIRLSKYINGFWVADLGTQALSQFNPAAWSSLLVEVRDYTNPARVSLRCYVNSELAEFEDAQPPLIPAGRVGLSVNSGVARFDNVKVEELQ